MKHGPRVRKTEGELKMWKPLQRPDDTSHSHLNRIFLAGTIDNGDSEDWQDRAFRLMQENFKPEETSDTWVFNPRRDDWDSTWDKTVHNKQFVQQVEWELQMLNEAETILFYFASGSKSPITLLELGMHLYHGDLIVVCPEGYDRRGNVEICCRRHHQPLVDSLEEGIEMLMGKLI